MKKHINKESNKQLLENDCMAMYFLFFQDIIERIDTLLLEIRHFQQNIIYLLHTPELSQALTYEELFLWFDNGDLDSINESKLRYDDRDLLDNIANSWIIEFQRLQTSSKAEKPKLVNIDEEMKKKYIEIQMKITSVVTNNINLGVWSNDQRAIYHNLHALQKLKQKAFRDKLEICAFASHIFNPYIESCNGDLIKNSNGFSHFLILRSVLLARLREYVERLGDQQVVFSHSQDFGLHDHPRPNIHRRRDQHLYDVHLADRCRDINREIVLLLEYFDITSYENYKLVFHHWKNDFSSKSYSFEGNLTNTNVSHHNINTSYWMPDRPDLQSVIAHEVAHGVVHDRLSKLDFEALGDKKSEFLKLLKHLNFCLQFFEDEMPSHFRVPLEEIVVDLLSTCIMGPAYLYAFLLEYMGFGLEELFTEPDNPNRFNVESVHYISNALGKRDLILDWYYRINIICTWLELIYPNDNAICDYRLVSRLIKSSREITERLYKFIINNTPDLLDTSRYWEVLNNRLCNILIESKKCTSQTKRWILEREKDGARNRNYPRSCIPLSPNLRESLVIALIGKKAERIENYNLEGIDILKFTNDFKSQFYNVYSLCDKFNKNQKTEYITEAKYIIEQYSNVLFNHLYDIPWQAAFIRGLDIMHEYSSFKPGTTKPTGNESNNNKKLKELFNEIHNSVPLGRGLYQIALDFNLHSLEPAWLRLVESIGLISGQIKTKHLEDDLIIWSGLNSNIQINDIDNIKGIHKEIIKLIRKNNTTQKDWEKLAINNSAYILAKTSQIHPHLNNDEKRDKIRSQFNRRLQKIQGIKLEQLRKLLTKHLDNCEYKFNCIFTPLYDYLNIRHCEYNLNKNTKIHDKILPALKYSNNAYSYFPEPEELTRICVSGSYADDGASSLPLSQLKNNWFIPASHKSKLPPENYQLVSSRYDIISIRRTRPMSRCYQPQFFSDNNNAQNDNNILPFVYFVRREMVIPVRLGEYWPSPDQERNFLAILAVTLKRPGSRLDFIYRLLDVINHQTNFSSLNDLCVSHHLKKCNLNTHFDRLYLSDNWADILIFFGRDNNCKNPSERLTDIFETQSIIFCDFQVDRTELILTPDCFNYAAIAKNDFSVSLNVRLLEDRQLSGANKNFIKEFYDRANKEDVFYRMENSEKNLKCKLSEIINLYRTPGRMDFNIHLKTEKNLIKQDIYRIIAKCLTENKYVERFQTIVKIKEEIESL